MKKVNYFIFVILCIMIPFSVKADGITKYLVNATLENNGDIIVEEYFILDGKYNGFERKINFLNLNAFSFDSSLDYLGTSDIYNGTDIELIEIKSLEEDENFDFSNTDGKIFQEVTSAKNGKYGVYTRDKNNYRETYKIYLPSKKKKAFYIKYCLKEMAVLHDDVGEIYWNIIGNELNESIDYLKITIHFPNNSEEFRIWAHGPLNGTIKMNSKQELEAIVTDLSAYESVDIRAVFDKEVIDQSNKKTGITAFPKILNYEENKANQANYERIQKEKNDQEKALESIEKAEETLDRYYYESALRSLKYITDETIQKEYLDRLEKIEPLITEKEETEAKKAVEEAIHSNQFFDYQLATRLVNELKNSELKEQLTKELEEVKCSIKSVENKNNRDNILLSLLLLAIVVIGRMILYFTYQYNFKSKVKYEYIREIPNSYSPTTVEYLFHKKITGKSVTAELLNLMNRKVITIENHNQQLILNEELITNLSKKEQTIIKLIFGQKKKIVIIIYFSF